MKRITTVLIFIAIIAGFISCANLDTHIQKTLEVTLDREPALTIVNNTGHPVVLTVPVRSTIIDGERTVFQPAATVQRVNITYTIGQDSFTEQVNWNNTEATVSLTKRPPSVIIVNNTGHPVNISAPVSQAVNNDARTFFLVNPDQGRNLTITYSIGQFQFTEQAIWNNQDVTVTLRSPPTVTIINRTGHSVNINAPFRRSLNDGDTTSDIVSPGQSRNITIAYQVGNFEINEQAALNAGGATVTLTRVPPRLTIVNNTGEAIFAFSLQQTGGSWTGGNSGNIRDAGNRRVQLSDRINANQRQHTINSGDAMIFWMEDITHPFRGSGDRFDIRINGVSGTTYVQSNVQIRGDMTIRFTQSDRSR